MDVVITFLEEKDLNEIVAIEEGSFPQPWTYNMFERETKLPFSRFFVMKIKDSLKIMGYAGYWVIDQEAHLTNLAISAEFRRQGWGKFLLTYVLEYAKSEMLNKINLEVRVSNKAAQNLYQEMGFALVSRRKGYYPYPQMEDALILAKEL